jgi:hypothetical protein
MLGVIVAESADPPSKYGPGRWLNADDILFVVQVVLGDMDVYSPTSYDQLLAALVEPREGDRRSGSWVPVVINTASAASGGLHWLMSLARFVAEPETVLWEPLADTRLSEPVKTAYEENGIHVTLHATGVQLNGWSCGYESCYWQAISEMSLAQGGDPSKWSDPPPPPPAWRSIIWLLLEARDVQRCDDSQGVAALAEIGVTELFRTALGSGSVVIEDFQNIIGPYVAGLASSLGSSSSSSPLSVQPPSLLMKSAPPPSHADDLKLRDDDDDDAVIIVDSPANKVAALATPEVEDVAGVNPDKSSPKKPASAGSSPMNYARYALRRSNSSFKRGVRNRILFEELYDKKSGDLAVLGDSITVQRSDGTSFSGFFIGGSNVKGRSSNQHTSEVLVLSLMPDY